MSTWADHEIRCVFCGHAFLVKLASGLHISRLPHVRDTVLQGAFHRFTCPSCERRLEVRQPVIYTDFERGHWIEIRPADDIARWPELAPACAATYHRAMERGSPLLRERAASFRVRLVFGYDELREKLVLWDAALDDLAVECRKLVALRRDVSMFGSTDRLLVRAIDGDQLVIDRHRADAVAGAFTLTASAGELAAARDDVTRSLDDPFPDPFVSINRLLGSYAVTAA